jgi:Zn finger protein HypA/HybF involved in hydrogenase expression
MEDSKKKTVMIGIIAVCLAVAAVVFIKTRPQDSGSTPVTTQMVSIKCAACGAEYQMDMQKYTDYLQKNTSFTSMQVPPLVCEKCGKETAYAVVKCPKCETTFLRTTAYPQCPQCGSMVR